MNIETYLQKKQERLEQEQKFRSFCLKCWQPEFGCYCHYIQSFDPKIKFVILIHPIEVKRRIATGRMSHLCLENSDLIQGQNYSGNARVKALLEDPELYSVVLSPGIYSKNLSEIAPLERKNIFPKEKKLVIFVLDGTWATAGKMLRQSPNLSQLPRICFSPAAPSNFRVRKQPSPECVSTIEAIHQTIELLGEFQGFDPRLRQHDQLLYVFDKMVQNQLNFIRLTELDPSRSNYRREYRGHSNGNA